MKLNNNIIKFLFIIVISLQCINCGYFRNKAEERASAEANEKLNAAKKIRLEAEAILEAKQNEANQQKQRIIFESSIRYNLESLYSKWSYEKKITKEEYDAEIKILIEMAKEIYNLSNSQLLNIQYHNLYIGMPVSLMYLSWGIPSKTNRTTTSSGEHIQYVFRQVVGSDKYAYVENDVITSWQD